MKRSITLSQACDGLVRYKSATGMSPNTIRNYRTTFAKLQAGFSIADPNDAGMLDIVGFDTAAPELITCFVRGEI